MARSKGPKFYAVAIGRYGPAIYESWEEAGKAVLGYAGATHCSFSTEREAKEWLSHHTGAVQVAVQQGNDQYTNNKQTKQSPLSQERPSHVVSSTARIPASMSEFQLRLTTRYAPYPNSASRPNSQGQSANRILTHGVPARNTPKSSSSQPSSSQANPIPISSDVEDDLMFIDTPSSHPSSSTSRSQMLPVGTPTSSLTNPFTRQAKLEESSTPRPQYQTPVHQPGSLPAQPTVQPVVDEFESNQDVIALPSDEPVLSKEQQKILNRVMNGESIFFTGSAGVGKSVLTRAIIRALETKYPHQNQVAVTATTGIAATNIGGGTLHSWAGLGLAKMAVDKLYWSLVRSREKQDVVRKWKDCKVLIIDEVSMLHATFFDKLEEIGRLVRGNSQPFGGIQLVITGDFFQLPPVPDFTGVGQAKEDPKLVFESKGWKSAVPNMVVLTEVFRQRDNTFVDLLNGIRMGIVTEEATATFQKLSRKVHYDDGVEPTSLYARRNQVLSENTRRLNQLEGSKVSVTAQDTSGKALVAPYKDLFPTDEGLRAFLDKNVLVEQSIDLKVGAQVMLVKNLHTGGLVNGSVGRVIGFASATQVAEANGKSVPIAAPPPDQQADPEQPKKVFGGDGQYPKEEYDDPEEAEWMAMHHDGLTLGYNSWPHVGKYKEGAPSSIKKEEAANQAAAALAAKKPGAVTEVPGAPPLPPTLVGVTVAAAKLSEREQRRLRSDPNYASQEGEEGEPEPPIAGTWPVVEFKGGRRVLLPEMLFSVEDTNGKVQASRLQVPLILAWALSIHKSQGQTLERVKIDMGDVFECGQAYVALSRATQLETLQVMRFYPNKVKVHPRVVAWYKRIQEGRNLKH